MVDVPLRKLSKRIIFFPLQEMAGLELRQAGAYLVLGNGGLGVKDVGTGLFSKVREKIQAEIPLALQAPFNTNACTFQPTVAPNLQNFSSPSKLSVCVWGAEEGEWRHPRGSLEETAVPAEGERGFSPWTLTEIEPYRLILALLLE